MVTWNWVNIGSGNGLLPDCTKPLSEPMLSYHQWCPLTIAWRQFQKRCLSHQLLQLVWKLFLLKFHSNLPGANELIHWGQIIHRSWLQIIVLVLNYHGTSNTIVLEKLFSKIFVGTPIVSNWASKIKIVAVLVSSCYPNKYDFWIKGKIYVTYFSIISDIPSNL